MKLTHFFFAVTGPVLLTLATSRPALGFINHEARLVEETDICQQRFATSALDLGRLNPTARSKFNRRLEDLNLTLVPIQNVDIKSVINFMDTVRKEENLDVAAMKARNVDRDLENASQMYDGHASEFFCLKKGNDIVATAALFKVADHTFEIRKFYVGADLRGQGVGRQMLRMLIEKAGENHAHRINLQTHKTLTGAIKLYESEGFVPDPQTPTKGPDMTAYTLRLSREIN